jgi:hypothetical protein
MMEKCTAYSATDRSPSPPKLFEGEGDGGAARNRLHCRHQPDRPTENLGQRNGLHVKHTAGEIVTKKIVIDNSHASLNASFMRELTSFEDEEVYTSPLPGMRSSINSPEPPHDGDDGNSLADSLLGHGYGSPPGESVKDRKKRERYLKKLTQARMQVARLPGYKSPKSPPSSVTVVDKENGPPVAIGQVVEEGFQV